MTGSYARRGNQNGRGAPVRQAHTPTHYTLNLPKLAPCICDNFDKRAQVCYIRHDENSNLTYSTWQEHKIIYFGKQQVMLAAEIRDKIVKYCTNRDAYGCYNHTIVQSTLRNQLTILVAQVFAFAVSHNKKNRNACATIK